MFVYLLFVYVSIYIVFFCFSFKLNTLINWICISCISSSLTLIWLHYGKKKNKSSNQVLFYDPLTNTNSCNCRYNFNINCSLPTCSSSKTREILLCLQRVQKSLDICMFAISNESITKVIIAAYNRGISVRIIVCNCVLIKSKQINMLKHAGIRIKYQENYHSSYMHHKFVIVDSTWLIQGSMNWTHQATYGNWENVLITDLQSLVIPFSIGFEKTWENTIFVP